MSCSRINRREFVGLTTASIAGEVLKELSYASRKIGIKWVDISEIE